MERIQLINPERIQWCCADYGITPLELASELGIAAASMERIVVGQDGLTFNQLSAIAAYFGRGVLFFLERGPVNAAQVHSLQFRTLANQKPNLSAKLKAFIVRAEKQRDVYLSLREDLDDADRLRFNPPKLNVHDLREAARTARAWLGLTNKNTFDTYRVAMEAKGILVFRSNGYNGQWQIDQESGILGFTLYDPNCPMIVVKKQKSESQQVFTLMHELGHLLLHKSSSIDNDQDMQSRQGKEQEANAFAGQLLVPDGFLDSINDVERPDDVSKFNEWLAQPRANLSVSGEVILRRLLDTGRLSSEQYQAYRNWASKIETPDEGRGNRQYRHREPKHIFGTPFVQTVLDALNARHITLVRASEYLDGIKIADLHKLERHYVDL